MDKNYLSLVAVGVLVSIVSGCATNRVSLVETNQVTVASQNSEKVKILWTDVYEQDGQAWAYGMLKQQGISTGSIKTHVDIQVLSQDGSVEYETITDDLFIPRNRVGKGSDWKRFRVQLPNELPKNSQIKITVHSGIQKK